MENPDRIAAEHIATTRRYFLNLSMGGAAGFVLSDLWAEDQLDHPALTKAIAELNYLTSDKDFRYVGRLRPKVSDMKKEERAAAGLTRETWQLEIFAEPDDDVAKVAHPMTREAGTAFTFDQLLELGKTRAVSYLKVMTCNNIEDPLGMGLWEGVPLRDVIWKTEPNAKVRRLHYHGFTHDDPRWMFRSSLSINRVFEDPPGGQPVLLCYKLNGKWLSPDRGGPVRILVPDSYGFKSVKWLRRIQLTSSHLNNDTYAEKSNDVDSRMKTYARILSLPEEVAAGKAIPLTGLAQCGESGLNKIQYWVKAKSQDWSKEDRYFEKAPWEDATILPPPVENWGDWEAGKPLPESRHQVGRDGEPVAWPLRNTIAHFAALLDPLPKGEYEVRVRSIDSNGIAQPMPRPFPKSGGNEIHVLPLFVNS